MIYNPHAQQNNFILHNENDSQQLAIQIAKTLCKGAILLFEGDIGSGKSFFCRNIIQYLAKQLIDVPSPTFNLLQTYKLSDFTIFHYDLYRLNHAEELYELSIEEALDNICLIEWPNLIENIIPRPFRKIHLAINNSASRNCLITLEE